MRLTPFALLLIAATSPTPADQKPDPNKKICEVFPPPVGTRLGERKICKTKAQWDEERFQNVQAISKAQNRDLKGE